MCFPVAKYIMVMVMVMCAASNAALDLLLAMAAKMLEGGEGSLAAVTGETVVVAPDLASFLRMVRGVYAFQSAHRLCSHRVHCCAYCSCWLS
jgi:hypothetical protein